MSQIQVKQIISSFCKILEWFNFSKITPEDLRLAKYNKHDAVKKMWKLLFELVSFMKFKIKGKLDNLLINDQFNELEMEKVVKYIKEDLLKFGYNCQDFYNLDHTIGEEATTSREILIAIGWFMSSYEIFNLFIENSRCFLDEEYFKENALRTVNINDIKKETDSLKSQINTSKKNDLFVQLNHIRLLDGIFKNKLNSLYSCLNEKAKLTYQAHSSSFSCLELYLLKNPEKIEKYEKILENKIELQTNILNWIKNEEIFWTWMESVVDEKINEKSDNDEVEDDEQLMIDNKIVVHVVKENMKNTQEIENCFNKNIKKLDDLEKEIKSNLSGEGMEGLSKEKLSSLKSFENDCIENFQKILSNQSLIDNSKENLNYLKFDSYEPKLEQIHKKSITVKQESSDLFKQNELLAKENKNLENIYNSYINKAIEKCEEISSNFNDCYVVYNK